MNSKLLGIFGALLLLTGCKMGAGDGYAFEGKQVEHTDRRISFVLYNSQAKLTEAVKRRNLGGADVFGFAAVNVKDNTCTVHIVDPAIEYVPQQMGHEITHCLYGNFHPTQG